MPGRGPRALGSASHRTTWVRQRLVGRDPEVEALNDGCFAGLVWGLGAGALVTWIVTSAGGPDWLAGALAFLAIIVGFAFAAPKATRYSREIEEDLERQRRSRR